VTVSGRVDPTIYLPEGHAAIRESIPISDKADIQSEAVVYEQDGTQLEGYLAKDTALDGRRPGVLIVHDWTGVGDNSRMRAQMIARLGYVALAADVYGLGVHPSGDDASALAGSFYRDLPLMRARVRAGWDELAARDDVDPERIAVMGYCFGGSAALEFARTGVQLAGVATFHGRLIAHEPSDAASIDARLLILTGGSDPVVPDSAIAEFQDELRRVPELDWQTVVYSGAPHAFTVPGGNYRPLADARSWAAMAAFFAEIFA
jgi:dienelactone hydrolase